MAIVLPKGLPAAETLRQEGLAVLDRADFTRRTLQLALVNLMPDRPATETQFARLLAQGGIDVDLTLVLPDGHEPRTTPRQHISAFYRRWSEVAARRFDALIVTGAPLEHLSFESVQYWHDLTRIFDWASARVRASYYVCWAAQAALYHFHGVRKHALRHKAFGVYPQSVIGAGSGLLRGLAPAFLTPVSRHTEVRQFELPRDGRLRPLAASRATGLCLVEDRENRAVCMFNHLEYDTDTLKREYLRDLKAGLLPPPPAGYFPGDDPAHTPVNTWRPAARRLFANWLDDIAEPDRVVLRGGAPVPPRPWLAVDRVTPRPDCSR